VRFKNRHNGVDVLGSNTAVVMNRQGGLVAISGATLNAEQAAASVSALTVREWGLSSKDAIAQAMEHMGHTEKAAWHYENARGDFEVFKSPGRARPVRVKRMYVPSAAGMTAAYYVETGLSVSPEGVPRAFAYLISAEDGTVLGRDNLVDDYQAYNYRVFTDTQGVPFEDPYGRNQPHPTGTPDGFIPTIPAPQQLISVAEISERVDDPWLPDGATETVGNNVDAFYNSIIKEDGEFDLFFIDPASSAEFRPQDGDFRAQITGPNTFDYTYDELDAPNDYIQLPPTDPDDPIPNTGAQLNAKIVNAFYVNNYLHDIFYDAGLDEAAGVAQTDNFGRGGIDGDPIKVMAGFAFGTFIATLGEGISPEMFMGHNGASLTARDSTLDNQVIGHEFGHYAVRRLVGRDVGFLTTSQARALNEGWSDFIGLFIMVDPEDGLPTVDPAWNGTFGVGAYTNRDYEFFPGFPIPVVTGTAAFDTYYHGVRRYPYTVDLNRNPLTLRMIADGEPLPDDVPIFDWKGRSRYNTEVHSAGEVWTAALWQCYNSILNGRTRLSFDEKQKRFVEYLVAGMKALPFNPTYTEARDGLLAVMKANDRRDYHLCRIAMAERGFGAGAISPVRDSRDLTGVKESFSKSEIAVSFIDAALDDSINSNDNDGILDAGETGLLTVTLRNSGFKNLRYVFAKLDRSPAYRTSRFGFMLFKRAAPGEDMTAQIPIRLLDDTQFANTDFKLRLLGLTRFFSPERDFEFAVNTHFNLDRVSAADDAEDAVAFDDWAVSIDDFTEFHPADPRWKRRLRDGNFVYQTAEGFAGYNSFLTSPELNVSLTEDFVINF
ncbi:MAG: M36 family metallopeptidase, partial [Gammaproteobacteria bacterium]|nr:M36 family metallopeptidase [Gammaproteobacteria bacterium]